ncbi:MAG: MltA domain-containing protein [Paracoccaceae bacterium]|nr:MltA domain-containing protein [Paracoccaceae bacterium]
MRPVSWAELDGWDADDHAAAWAAFSLTDAQAEAPPSDSRAFFEENFDLVEVAPAGTAHFTGYYEPELPASRHRSAAFSHPLYATPPGFDPAQAWHSRAEIVAGDLLDGREIAFVETAIEAFLAQVQGSVRLRLTEGGCLRLGFAAKNGHPYRSIGAELLRRGVGPAVTPDVIRHWCAENPDQVQDLLNHNPSFVFFRELDLPEGTGPLGAMGQPVTARRSLAVDPDVIPLGSPVWVACPGLTPRLMVAQDIGAAIKGAGRGDIFCGTGTAAGTQAGKINDYGQMIWLRRRG